MYAEGTACSLNTCTLHNSETLEPLNCMRVRPSHCHERTPTRTHVLYCHHIKIIKYATFKMITCIVISYIDLPTVLTLKS